MKLIVFAVGMFGLLVALAACSGGGGDDGIGDGAGHGMTGELTRDVAADLLQEYFERAAPLEWARGICPRGDINIDRSVSEQEANAALAELQSRGYITDWSVETVRPDSLTLSASPTESGTKYLVLESGSGFFAGSQTSRIGACELKVEEVTGMRAGVRGAVVEYTFRSAGPTEPFEILAPILDLDDAQEARITTLVCRDEAEFALFDDGWRVDSAFSAFLVNQECE